MKNAVILAGGLGKRLHPYTVVLPKPLMPIEKYPVLEIIIMQLSRHGFTNITLAVNHQADIIRAYFGSGEKWGVNIDYSLESTPLGTMGPLKIMKNLPDNFLIMNGDILTDIDFDKMYQKHTDSKAIFSIASTQRLTKIDYGVLQVEKNKLKLLKEKPEYTYEVSTGVYMASNKILKYIEENRLFGFDELMNVLISMKLDVNVFRHDGYWLDIGRPDDYIRAINEYSYIESRLISLE